MTQTSYYQDGALLGDASLAPYSDETITYVEDTLHSNQSGVLYGCSKFSGTDGYLAVTRTNATTISVAAGCALVNGTYFESTAATALTVARNCTTPFWVRVIIGFSDAGVPSIQLLYGSSSATIPEIPPSTKQVGDYSNYLSLAKIYVPAAGDIVQTVYIFDERVFIQTPKHYADYVTDNIFHNSENIMRVSIGTSTEYSGDFINFERSRPVKTSSSGSFQSIKTTNSQDQWVTTAFYIKVLSGYVYLQDNGATFNTLFPTIDPVLILYRKKYTAATKNQEIGFSGFFTGIIYGQLTASFGLIPAPFKIYHEYIQLGGLPSTYFNTVDIQQCKALITSLKHVGTASAGVDECYSEIVDRAGGASYLRVETGRLTNSTYRFGHGIIRIRQDDLSSSPYVVQYSAGGSPSATVYFIGAQT